MLNSIDESTYIVLKDLSNETKSISKIAFTGTHGTGKTTSVFKLAADCKLHCSTKSVHIITETASESPFKINKNTTPESQLWIFTTQIKRELENSLRYKLLISDRTIVDCIAYSTIAGFKDLAKNQIEMAKSFIGTYDYIFYKSIEKNNFVFEDGIRDAKDMDFRKNMDCELKLIYDKLRDYIKPEALHFI